MVPVMCPPAAAVQPLSCDPVRLSLWSLLVTSYLNHYSQINYWDASYVFQCPVFQRSLLREFLLTKLINAEISCYKAQQFSRLEVEEKLFLFMLFISEYPSLISNFSLLSCPFSLTKLRTRSSLLESLQAELSTRSQCMMGDPSLSALPSSEGGRGTSEGSGGFIENFKVHVDLPRRITLLTLLFPLCHFPSESLSSESHQSAEPLFWDSWGTQEDRWQRITEA